MAREEHPLDQHILLTRWHTVIAIVLLEAAVCPALYAMLLAVWLLTDPPRPEDIGGAVGMLLACLFGLFSFCALSWYLPTHKHWLVIGAERLECRVSRRIRWGLQYQNIDHIALFRCFGAPCLGFRLRTPELFDRTWPRVARERRWWQRISRYDFAVIISAATEPPERILEAALRCLHRFRLQEAALAAHRRFRIKKQLVTEPSCGGGR